MFSNLPVPKVSFFFSPFFPVDPFHIVNPLLSHSSSYFLYSRILRCSFPSSSKLSSFDFFFFFDVASFYSFFTRDHTSQLFVSYVI